MNVEIINVTPDLARTWLAKNLRNRAMNRPRVEVHKKSLTEGRFKLTHQGVALDVEGNLLDGQHRLTAIAETGIPATMVVAFAADPASFDLIDTGRVRSAGDVLGIDGHSNAKAAAATAKLIMRYYSGARPWPKDVTTPDSVRRYADTNREALGASVIAGMAVGNRIGASRSAFGAAHYVARTWSSEQGLAREFAEWWAGLETGAGLEIGDGRLAISSWINGAGRQISSQIRAEILMLATLRAWHAHLTGESLKKILISNVATYSFALPI